MSARAPNITGLTARPVDVPIARPLATGGGAVSSAPLVLIDLETDSGITGHSYVFAYTALALKSIAVLIADLGVELRGSPTAPADIAVKLQAAFRLLGYQGFVSIAIAGIEMAAWDVAAKVLDVTLVELLGGTVRTIPAYNSNGLGLIGANEAAREAADLLAPEFQAIKVRLGYPSLGEDIAVVRAVRKEIGPDVALMSDYNQCLAAGEAVARITALEEFDLTWIEEPVRFDDYRGAARIRARTKTAIQLGENCWGPHEVKLALAADATDYLMPDVEKCAGIIGWLSAAALAQAHNIPVSSHLFPEVSVHLLAVIPNRHWLEYVDWANPVLKHPLKIAGGHAHIPDRPGLGIEWDEKAVGKYAV